MIERSRILRGDACPTDAGGPGAGLGDMCTSVLCCPSADKRMTPPRPNVSHWREELRAGVKVADRVQEEQDCRFPLEESGRATEKKGLRSGVSARRTQPDTHLRGSRARRTGARAHAVRQQDFRVHKAKPDGVKEDQGNSSVISGVSVPPASPSRPRRNPSSRGGPRLPLRSRVELGEWGECASTQWPGRTTPRELCRPTPLGAARALLPVP